ncbi:histidine phosphatase family protein [Saccharospirillum sp. HFRX-1]|uniref:histidine phosphatase family protein n=1 Tax=unclassified Saccharospirillum TaxID=2633430 RepID=UPI003714E075
MFNSPQFVRHGAPLETGFCYGHSDPILLATPAQTAARLKLKLAPWQRLFTSPSPRCAQLALALDEKAELIPALRELNFGDWEGKAWDAIDRAGLDRWAQQPLEFVIPGGESGRDLYRRVADWANTIRLGKDDLIIAHAGSLRALAAVLLECPFDDCWQWPLAYATAVRLHPNTAGFVSEDTA